MRHVTVLMPFPQIRAFGRRASLWRGAAGLLFPLLLGAGVGEAADARGRDLFHGAGQVTGLTFTLATNLPSYLPGALHELSASVSSTIAVTADVYIVIQLPSGGIISLQSGGGSSPRLIPFISGVSVPAGFTFPMQPILSAPLPTLPFGTYTWYGAFTVPGTLSLLSNLAQASWVLVSPTDPGAPTPVVWVPDFFGQKVEVRRGEGAGTTAVTLPLNPAGTTPCSPNSVAVNGGKLYVVCLDSIRVYDANTIRTAAAGAVLSTLTPEKTITDAEFNELIGIAFDAQNNLWVASFAANTILQVPAASLATATPTVDIRLPNSPASPVALAFDTDGSMWVAGQFGEGIVVNFPPDQIDESGSAAPRYCISNAAGGCAQQAGLFKNLEGLAIFNGKVWVANNGGNVPGRELVALEVQGGSVVVVPGYGVQNPPAGVLVCPGGLFATSQHLWVNDQGFGDAGTDCGASVADQGSGVGAVLRFTQPQLDAQTTDTSQLLRFTDITSRPGFGGIFVEGD